MRTVIEMAREAGFTELEFYGNKLGTNPTECLERFVAFVAAAEREACANDWETLHGYDKHGVAAAIRARGNA